MAQLGFDATQVAPDSGQLDPVPAGWYKAMVDESEVKPTSDGLGARLAVRFTIVDGEYANRKIYTGFNIRNANPVAQEIAFKQLSALAHAVGVLQVQDSSQLHNIPLKIRVKIKPPRDGYEAQNEITTYRDINHNVDTGSGGAAPGGAPAAPAAPAAPSAPAAPGAFNAGAAPAQPWQQPASAAPAAPAAPVAPAPAAPVADAPPPFTPPAPPAPPAAPAAPFPPEGWTAHPTAPGFFYQGQEVLSEADLRARVAPQAAPPAPPAAPAAAPVAEAAPDPAATAQVATPPWQTPKQ